MSMFAISPISSSMLTVIYEDYPDDQTGE